MVHFLQIKICILIYYAIKYIIVNVGAGSLGKRSQFWNKTRFGAILTYGKA